jgi:DNA-binding NtrC family response regulator
VLVLGPTGAGKEQVANLLGRHLARLDGGEGKVHTINAANYRGDLLRSELFDHRAGAFTGATRHKMGIVEAAEGEALFVDEVGEMDPIAQGEFLRFAQSGTYYRLGDEKEKTADVQLVSATNRDAQWLVDTSEEFRRDLYFRLSQVTVTLPSLHERVSSLEAILEHLIEKEVARVLEPVPKILQGGYTEWIDGRTKFTARYLAELWRGHVWEGNLRECANRLSAVIGHVWPQWEDGDPATLRRLLETAVGSQAPGGHAGAVVARPDGVDTWASPLLGPTPKSVREAEACARAALVEWHWNRGATSNQKLADRMRCDPKSAAKYRAEYEQRRSAR